MQALAAGRLAEGDKAERLKPLRISLAASITVSKGNIGSGVEIEHEATRQRRDGPARSSRGGIRSAAICAMAIRPSTRSIWSRACDHPRPSSAATRFDMPGIAWRWKNFSPLMPSGARMMEQGRPLRCSIIHGPTFSR